MDSYDRHDEPLAELATQAVTQAARDLGLDPRALATELAQGEIGLLIHYLRAALPAVDDPEVREGAQSLLHRLTAWTQAQD